MVSGERLAVPHSAGVEPPRMPAPAGATDTHHHIFDPRFPRPEARTGVWATASDYTQLRRRLGLTRSVVIAPSSYGYDNECLIDALDAFGDSARGVAVIKLDTPDAELDRLHAHGVRGIRLYMSASGVAATAPAEFPAYARRIERLGWHIQLVVGTHASLVTAEPELAKLRCTVVLDHFAYVPQPDGIHNPAVSAMRRLLDNGRTYVKLSGVYITSKEGFPHYSDVNELAIELARAAPDRMLWGTDWPHTGVPKTKPDGALLFEQLAIWAPDTGVRHRILVDNPQRLYWSDNG
jgi:predicted TIM-barrel fold metal-dependent hydrolase